MKVKNLYLGWIYRITSKEQRFINAFDYENSYAMQGVKLALFKKNIFGGYKVIPTGEKYSKIKPFTKKGDLVISESDGAMLPFTVFEDFDAKRISEEEALKKYQKVKTRIVDELKNKK